MLRRRRLTTRCGSGVAHCIGSWAVRSERFRCTSALLSKAASPPERKSRRSRPMAIQAVHPQWHERRLGRTILKTYRAMVDLNDVFPNERQPRMGPKDDVELQRQIEANEGVF